jgi:tripartite-type tricarboxylate transporter receptor subunit TctC
VPTVAESGYKDYDAKQWFRLFAPAKTPKETVSQLVGWFTAALQVPEVKAKLAIQGLYLVGICGADFGAFIRKQYDDYGRAIREANIKPPKSGEYRRSQRNAKIKKRKNRNF